MSPEPHKTWLDVRNLNFKGTCPLIALTAWMLRPSLPPAGAFGRGPEDHQRGEEEEERDDSGDRAPVRRLHHAGLHGRQPAQKREECVVETQW